jgi:hypothetical protein
VLCVRQLLADHEIQVAAGDHVVQVAELDHPPFELGREARPHPPAGGAMDRRR